MIYNFAFGFMIFFIFSVVGYLCEVISVSIIKKELYFNRGYFIGPYLPIFGFGTLFILLFLDKYKNDFIVLFILSMFFCSILEYFTSYLLESIFKLRWWDYSDKRFNINGRICLETGILFGLGSILIMWFCNKYLYVFLIRRNDTVLIIVSIILFIIMMLDLFFSTSIIIKLRNVHKKIKDKDNTEVVRKEIFKELKKHKFLYKRFIDSFPHIRIGDEYFEKIHIFMEKIRKRDNNE